MPANRINTNYGLSLTVVRATLRKFTASVARAGFVGALACSSSTDPESALPTLYVTNPLCEDMACPAIQVRAFVWAFLIPQNPYGSKSVGRVDGAAGCLQFPASWTASVREVDSLGEPTSRDSTVYRWTPDHPDGIYLVAVQPSDWATPGAPPVSYAVGITPTFVPGDAKGWELRFSQNPDTTSIFPFLAILVPSDPCKPSEPP